MPRPDEIFYCVEGKKVRTLIRKEDGTVARGETTFEELANLVIGEPVDGFWYDATGSRLLSGLPIK